MNEQQSQPRKAYLWEAIISFGFLIAVMAIGIAKYEVDPHIPMLVGTIFAAIMALKIGYSWDRIEKSMFHGIYQALQAIIILAIIGVLIGVWILAGVVPSMIYYGLGILRPSIFLVASVIIASITSLATGTSWGTVGTIGIALMGIAAGLGIPLPMAAGAIISGAYFGDKLSPLSDTTNLAPAVAGTDVFTHVKFMLKSTIVVYIITLGFFLFLGFKYGQAGADLSAINTIRDGLSSNIKISPLLLLPPLAVILSIALKVPAIPGITIGIILGVVEAFLIQGVDLGQILNAAYSGFESATGIVEIDELLTAGGLENMMFSISLTILAMMFGGIMEETGQLEAIVKVILRFVKGAAGLITATVFTCILSNSTMPEQYIAIVVPGRMFAPAYKEKGFHPKMLSNALESAGTVTSALIPWNTCGVFMSTTLGVSVGAYFKFAIFNYLMPLAAILLALPGITVALAKDDPGTIIDSNL